jgi:hypothetical protein
MRGILGNFGREDRPLPKVTHSIERWVEFLDRLVESRPPHDFAPICENQFNTVH